MKQSIIPFMLAALFVVSCYDKDIESINSRLDAIENSSIASINQQITNITRSIGNLEETDKEVKGYISTLQNSLAELQKSLNTTNDKIESAKGEVRGEIEILRKSIEGEISVINSAIKTLQEKDESLEGKISSLKQYIDEELGKSKSWAESSFATLSQYNQIVSDVSGINTAITTIRSSISELETNVNNRISNDLAESEKKITQEYNNAVAKAKTEIEEAYTLAIQTAIATSMETMKTWVNEQLTAYATISSVETKIQLLNSEVGQSLLLQKEGLESLIKDLSDSTSSAFAKRDEDIKLINERIIELEGKIGTNSEAIKALASSIDSTKAEITAAYTEAIEEAVNTLEGKLDEITSAKIQAINKSIIDGINDRLSALEGGIVIMQNDIHDIGESITSILSSISELSNKLDSILKSIQSISVVPDYSDGSVSLLKLTPKANVFRFDISPKKYAEELVKLGTEVFAIEAIYTQTKAVGETVSLAVTAAEYKDGKVCLTVDASAIKNEVYYWKNGISVNATLNISNGYTDRTSSYFQLTPTVPGAVDLGLSVWWATCDIGADSPEVSGTEYPWGYTSPYNTSMSYPMPKEVFAGSWADISGTEYDAARSTLGSPWCMPNREDIMELRYSCSLTGDMYNYPYCYFITGPSGKRIIVTPGTRLLSDGRHVDSPYESFYWYVYTPATGSERYITYSYSSGVKHCPIRAIVR